MKKNRLSSFLLALSLTLGLLAPMGAAQAAESRSAILDGMEVEATAAILVDTTYGSLDVLYDQNSHERRYPASITKVMTALLVMEAIDAGQMTADTMITASETSQQGLSIYGSTQNIKPGETISVKDLLYCLLVPSANEAANILAEAVDGSVEEFVAHMNRKAGELGCQGTHFANPHGLHNDDHYTTALDLAHIVKAAMEYDLFRQIVYTSVYETAATNMSAPRTFYNTNGLITQWRFRGYLYDKAIGVKTGSTDEAGYCLASAAQDGDDYLIAVVLGSETSQQRFEDAKTMLNYGFSTYVLADITPEETPVAPVRLGRTPSVEASLAQSKLLVGKGQAGGLTRTVKLQEDLSAPVEKGQAVGILTVQSGDTTLAELPLTAAAAVERMTWGDLFTRLLRAAVFG